MEIRFSVIGARLTVFNSLLVLLSGLIVSVNCMLSPSVHAEEVSLNISPHLCITDQADKTCTMNLLFEWLAQSNGDYCLVDKKDKRALQCWSKEQYGQWEELLKIQVSRSFLMTQEKNQQPLAEESVEVLSTYSEDRRRNRRRKHIWSLL